MQQELKDSAVFFPVEISQLKWFQLRRATNFLPPDALHLSAMGNTAIVIGLAALIWRYSCFYGH